MGTPDDVIGQSALYMRIYFMGMPFFMLYNYGAAILRAIGDTKRPLIFLIISGIANAALNMTLVILFHMGVAGVAIGTIISQLISCVLVLTCLYRSEGSYQLRFSKLKINGAYMEQIFQVGVPAGIQSTGTICPMHCCSLRLIHWIDCDGRLYSSEQYTWVPLYVSEFDHPGMYEFYQSELWCG